MPTPDASDATLAARPIAPDPALVARFAADLGPLIDIAGDRLLVAVSGGPDSVALLLLAQAALGERCLAATVDHGLRPAAAAEAEMVAALCARIGVRHRILRGSLPARAGRTANVSARARALRYRLLAAHADEVGAQWLATAHHADDQLETMLMRLNRGAGVAGLAAVRRRSGRVVRPLLGWRRATLGGIVTTAGIVPAADPSNADDRYDRARLRKALAEADWLDPERAAASAAALGEAEEALAWATREAWAARVGERDATLSLDPSGLPAELVRRLVTACIARIDAAATPDGPALSRAIAALHAGRAVTLGGAQARPGVPWCFRPAPPRRNA